MKLQFLSQQLPSVMRLPFLFIVAFTWLFVLLGWTFISGLLVFALAFWFNLKLSRIAAKL